MKPGARDRLKALLQLVRFPNLFTAAADVLAGYLLVSAHNIVGSDLLGLVVASAALYAGGCVLNDWCDWEEDARERPFRPLPSGRVSPWMALLLLFVLLGAALWAASAVGAAALSTALLLTGLIIAYDGFTKRRAVVGPLNMAACRSCNLILGMSASPPASGIVVLFPLLTLVYVFALTVLSRFEVCGPIAERAWVVITGWLAVMGALLGLGLGGSLSVAGLTWLAVLVLFTAPPLWRTLQQPIPDTIGTAVKHLILGLPLLDATYVAGTQGMGYALLVAACIVPAVVTARRLYVT